LGERYAGSVEVTGSSPVSSITERPCTCGAFVVLALARSTRTSHSGRTNLGARCGDRGDHRHAGAELSLGEDVRVALETW
jgi:hypothetical protein